MWFNSKDFLCFILMVLPVFYLLGAFRAGREMPRLLFLTAASYFFYMYWNPAFIVLIVLSTVVDYFCGLLFLSWPEGRRGRIIAISAISNLGILAFFKYGKFLYTSLSPLCGAIGLALPAFPEAMDFQVPLGISFYTFQTMSYTIDIYRGKVSVEKNFLRFALFVAYFPQLVAGPIEKARSLLPQLRRFRPTRQIDVSGAVQKIAYGLFKKIAVADSIALAIDPVFAAPGDYGGSAVLAATVLFSFQIYCDFSGYTDIAIGVARLFGIRLSMNFFFPYFATNIRRFWQRWHMSLSSWLREYLYIPLGGNRKGRGRTYVNLMATMLLGGLWHGASWNFVIWGGLHGVYLGAHRLFCNGRLGRPSLQKNGALAMAKLGLFAACTFGLVTLTWIPFRCVEFGHTITCLSKIFTWADGPGPAGCIGMPVCWLLAAILLAFDGYYYIDSVYWSARPWSRAAKNLFPVAFLLLTIVFGAGEARQFIYFQF